MAELGEYKSDLSAENKAEEACCRICRCGTEDGRELFHPCICTGTMRYVHEDCLMEWLSRIGSQSQSKCEVCGHHFRFRPIYSPDTPKCLSAPEMTRIGFYRILKYIPFAFKIVVLCFGWGIFVPQITAYEFRSMSLRKGGMVNGSALDEEPLPFMYGALNDWSALVSGDGAFGRWSTGVAICIGILASFLALLIVFEYVQGWLESRIEAQVAEAEDEFEDEVLEPLPRNEAFDQFDGFDFDEPELPGEEGLELHLALDEIIGLRGTVFRLLHNITCLLIFNGIFLVVLFYFPTFLGAVVMTVLNSCVAQVTGIQLLSPEDVSFVLRAQKPENYVFAVPLKQCMVEDMFTSGEAMCTQAERDMEIETEFWENVHWSLLEAGTFALGHIAFGAITHTLFKLTTYMAEQTSSNASVATVLRKLGGHLEMFSCTIKVAILVVLKMILFPVALGMLLEKNARSLFAFTASDRLEFALNRPMYTGLIFWVAGITHMLVITVLVVQLREVLHEDVLKGLIRSHDPNTNLIRILLVEPVTNHLRRMIVSCAIYTVLIALFVSMPLRVITEFELLSGSTWFPLVPTFNYYFLEIQLPVELGCFHLLALHILDSTKGTVLKGQVFFVQGLCKMFGLTRYLLPCPKEDDGGDTVAQDSEETEPELLPREVPTYLFVRLGLFLVCSWILCMTIAVSLVSTPFIVGGTITAQLKLPLRHDPYKFFLGCFVVWRVALGVFSLSPQNLAGAYLQWPSSHKLERIKIVMQWSLLFVLTCVVLPCMIGILLEICIFLPAENSLDKYSWEPTDWRISNTILNCAYSLSSTADGVETHVLGNEWMMGASVVFVCVQIVMNVQLSSWLGTKVLTYHILYKEGIEEMKEYRCTKMLNSIVLPASAFTLLLLSLSLLLSLAVDWVVYSIAAVSLAKLYGMAYLFRRSIAIAMLLPALPYVTKQVRYTMGQVHDALRDDKYLVGRQLLNMEKRLQSEKLVKKRNVM